MTIKKINTPVFQTKYIIALCILLGLMILGLGIVYFNQTAYETTTIQNVFVDVNGDGKQDMIVKGEVIFNKDFLLPTPQIEKK